MIVRAELLALAVMVGSAVAGCAIVPEEIGREPALSPVGAGLDPPPSLGTARAASAKDGWLASGYESGLTTGSLWSDRSGDLFKDFRARRPGDVLTVAISIKDKASLDNSSKRSRDAASSMGLDLSHGIDWRGYSSEGTASAASSVQAATSHDGKGQIARSESIDLRLAAVVTAVLPNGNLYIQGSQEVRVNYELRVLMFSGIVNIADIRADNTIPYERVAEARMSYGGRGRSMEVQQPGWGQQIIDQISPY